MLLKPGLWLSIKGIITAAIISGSVMGIGLLLSASAGAFLLATDSIAPLLGYETAPALRAPTEDSAALTLTPTPFQPESPHGLIAAQQDAARPELPTAENPAAQDPTDPTAPSDTPIASVTPTDTAVVAIGPSQTNVPSVSPTAHQIIPFIPSATKTAIRKQIPSSTPKKAEPKTEPATKTPTNTPSVPSATASPTIAPTSGDASAEPTMTSIPSVDATTGSEEASATATSVAPSSTPTPTSTNTPKPPTNTPVPTAGSSGCNIIYNSSFESHTLELINQKRSEAGMAALTFNGALAAEAREHSVDQALHDFLSHTGSDGSSFWQRAIRNGYTGHWGGEIIYSGGGLNGSPEQAISWWMNSSPHKAMILGDLNDFGAGYAYCPNSGWGGFITVGFGHR
jgi:uncharacterized protein YkwD